MWPRIGPQGATEETVPGTGSPTSECFSKLRSHLDTDLSAAPGYR